MARNKSANYNSINQRNKSTGKSANTNRALSGVTRFVPAEEAPTTFEPTLNECTYNVQAKMPHDSIRVVLDFGTNFRKQGDTIHNGK